MFTNSLHLLAGAALALAVAIALSMPSVRQSVGDYVSATLDSYMARSGLQMYIMNPGQARVIDPILSTVARGYQNADFVGNMLFPVVPVDSRGGKIITFGKEDFKLYNTGRAPGGSTKRVQYGHLGEPYALEQHALEGLVPFEIMQEANQVPGIDLGKVAVLKTQNIIALRNEHAQAALATNPANYAASNKITLADADKWSDYSGTSDPTGDVTTGVEVVRSKTGKRGNTVVLSPAAFKACKNHPKIIDRIKHTGRDIVTTELLASLWDVKHVVVGDAIYADDAGDFTDVWGQSVVIAYTETGSLQDMGLPSYGYTYRLRNNPLVESPYQDRNQKSWVYPVTDELNPVIAGALGGYLISAAAD